MIVGPHILRKLFLMFAVLCFMNSARAGGDYSPVIIKSLEIRGDDYKLVLTPDSAGAFDPYMGSCKIFTVHGTYDTIWWLTRSGPREGKKSHKRALELLNEAFIKKEKINFGWMGSGFKRLSEADPCNVNSKALDTLDDPKGVISFYGSV